MRHSPFLLMPLIIISIALFSCDAATQSSGETSEDQASDNYEGDDQAEPYQEEQEGYAEDDAREDEEKGDWDEEGLTDAERMRRAAIAAGLPMPDEDVPEVIPRTYTAGHMTVKVSGFFEIDASPPLDTQASISDGAYTWIQFGRSGAEPPNATVTIGNGDIGISVAVGKFGATGTTTECTMTTDVTPSRVSGHFSCPKVTGYDQGQRVMGDVSIEVDFEASS